MTFEEYVANRVEELDRLMAVEPEDSKHRYAMMAAQYELILAYKTIKGYKTA